jgi:hypothetical protein
LTHDTHPTKQPPRDLTITIEGKAGKIILLAGPDAETEKKIRLVAGKFEEKQ